MSDNVLFLELFNGDAPPKPGAWKSFRTKPLPNIDAMLEGAATGASDPLVKQIETDDLINQLAQGAPSPLTKKSETLLSDQFMSKHFLTGDDFLKSLSKGEFVGPKCACACSKCKDGACKDAKCSNWIAAQKEADKLAAGGDADLVFMKAVTGYSMQHLKDIKARDEQKKLANDFGDEWAYRVALAKRLIA